ncbi:MAG TPA: DUF2019 domain-containing protein [Stellaceae bacterium]|nr:DUF2019 domain-containing protein [Stellaceae bacterium]
MSTGKLSHCTPHELVEQFRSHALEQQSVLLDSDTRRYNKLFDLCTAIVNELKRRGPQALEALLVLLKDPNLRVRLEAARRLVDFAPSASVAALKEVEESQMMPEAGTAGMSLHLIEERVGKLPK